MNRFTAAAPLIAIVAFVAGCTATNGAPSHVGSPGRPSNPLSATGSVRPVSTSPVPASPESSGPALPATTAAGTATPSTPGPAAATTTTGPAAVPSTAGFAPAEPTPGSTNRPTVPGVGPSVVGTVPSILDADTATWFTRFCAGFAPVLELSQEMSSPNPDSDPTRIQSALVGSLGAVGRSFTATSAALEALPAPRFAGGAAFAVRVIDTLGTAGPAFSGRASQLARVDASKDPAALQNAQTQVPGSVTQVLEPLADLTGGTLTGRDREGFLALPACGKLIALSGG